MAILNGRIFLKLDNSNVDDLGNYTPTDVGTPAYSSGIKHDGTHSFDATSTTNNNCIQLPSQLMTDINTYDDFSISFWGYHESSQDFAFYISKGDAGQHDDAGFIWAYTYRPSDIFVFRWDGANVPLSEFTSPEEDNTWIHWAFTWEGTASSTGTLKVYKNNSLIGTYAGVASSFGPLNTYFYVGGSKGSDLAHNSHVDSFIITNDIPASFPIPETAAGAKVINLMQRDKKLNIMEGM